MARIKLGDLETGALFAGSQGYYEGLDQLNLLIPRSLAERGEMDVLLTVNGEGSNTVKISIK